MAKVLFLYVNAGYGHRKVAEAVYRELSSRQPEHLELEIFDALEKTNSLFENLYPKIYYELVVYAPWIWKIFFDITNLPFVYPLISPLRSFWNWLQSKNLRDHIQKGDYNFIVSTHFFPAEVCASLKKNGKIKSNSITIVTDVIPHRVWINPGTDHYWVMADESARMLTHCGVDSRQIHIRGIPISSDFTKPIDRSSVRKKLNLEEDRLTILLTSGSFGMGPIHQELHILSDLKDQIQVIVVCGHNKILLANLNRENFLFPVRLFGFVNNMYELMSASDLLIAKPGGATTCESLVKELPMIMVSPIPGQETHNANWLSSHEAAFKIKSSSEIKDIVKQIVQNPKLLKSMQSAIRKIAKPEATKDLAAAILKDFKYE